MNKREKLLRSREYVITAIQLNLLNMVEKYMAKKKFKKTQLADDLGVTKGYVSQLMNASYDHKISKMADLSLHCNVMPLLNFVDLDEYIQNDAEDNVYELIPAVRIQNVTYSKDKFPVIEFLTSDLNATNTLPTTVNLERLYTRHSQ